MLLGIVNVNTSESMTRTILRAAQSVAAPDTSLEGITPTIGAESVETHIDGYLSAVGILEAVNRRHQDKEKAQVDAWIIAGYGDQGKEGVQELVDVPVVDITEASAIAAMAVGDRYAVVTTLDRTTAMIRDRLSIAGLLGHCISIQGTGLGVLELEKDPARTEEIIIQKAQEAVAAGAEVICLGCGGMAGLAEKISHTLGIPVVDGVEAAVGQAESLVRQKLKTSRRGTFGPRISKKLPGFEQFYI